MDDIIEFFGELLLRSKKVKPWVKAAFVWTLLAVFGVVMYAGAYKFWKDGESVQDAVILCAFTTVFLGIGIWYAWKCHKSNWDSY